MDRPRRPTAACLGRPGTVELRWMWGLMLWGVAWGMGSLVGGFKQLFRGAKGNCLLLLRSKRQHYAKGNNAQKATLGEGLFDHLSQFDAG